MSEINETKFIEKTDSEIKKYDLLKKAFQNIYSSEKSLYDKRKSAFDSIEKIKETDNIFLKDIYSEFTSQMKNLEECRNEQISRIKDKIIPATNAYASKAKTYKQNLGKYKEIKTKNKKKQSEKIEVQSKGDGEKGQQIEREINQNINLLCETGKDLEKNILLFEADRISDNKYLILHFIHSELAYHAKALENLSLLYQKIKNIEPIEKLKDFQEKYALNTVDLSEFGYNEREIKRREKMREEEGKQNMGNLGPTSSQISLPKNRMNEFEENDYDI